MDKLSGIDPQKIDILKEIGNIGAGNAVTALATMLDRTVDMSVPRASVVPFYDIVNILNNPEEVTVSVLVGMNGDINGYMLLVIDPKDAFAMGSMILGEKREAPEGLNSDNIDELDRSLLCEVGNILIGSYLSAICSLTGLNIVMSVPQLAVDMIGAALSIIAIEYSQLGDLVLLLETEFTEESRKINGHFFLVPEADSYKVLMKSIGIDT